MTDEAHFAENNRELDPKIRHGLPGLPPSDRDPHRLVKFGAKLWQVNRGIEQGSLESTSLGHNCRHIERHILQDRYLGVLEGGDFFLSVRSYEEWPNAESVCKSFEIERGTFAGVEKIGRKAFLESSLKRE
jgi:hypothetical protein